MVLVKALCLEFRWIGTDSGVSASIQTAAQQLIDISVFPVMKL